MARRFGASSIVQTISLTAGSPPLDVDNEVDWHEQNRLLKVAFPVSVRSSRATYEIQYGHVERPTHANTSWEAARFEVCAHKWADSPSPATAWRCSTTASTATTSANVMRLSLLRSPNWPDPVADRGIHRFRYQLLPHAGDLRPAGVIDAGYDLNVPLRAMPTTPHPGHRPSVGSFLSVDTGHAVIEVVKPADGQPDGLVVRLYEAWGGRGPVPIRAPWPVGRATRTDLLERELAPVESEGDRIHLDLRPFEIVTVKLER